MLRDAVLWVLGTALLLQNCHVSAGVPGFLYPGSEQSVSEVFSHADNGNTLYSSDNYLKCISDLHVTPTSTQDVSDLVKLHTAGDKAVKIRVTRRGYHSSAGFVCAGERASTKLQFNDDANVSVEKEARGTTSITILLHLMNRVVAVDSENNLLTVEAGMTLHNLADAAEANHMSVRAGAFSVYGNLTVGGVIAASAHGSGLGTTSSLGDLVTKVKWVNAKGDIIVSDSATRAGAKEVRALVGGLGLLGVATEFTFQLEPPSRTIVESRNGLDDTNMVSELETMLKVETPHVIAHWRPDFGTYRAILFTHVGAEDKLPASAPAFRPNARLALMDAVDNRLASAWSGLMNAWEADSAEESAIADVLNEGVCRVGAAMNEAPIIKDEDGTPIEHATLSTNYAMLSAECSPKCLYQPRHMGTVAEDVEFTIKLSQLEEWVQDVKAIVKAELEGIQAGLDKRYGKGKVTRCMPPGYFWIRFGRGSQNLLSTSAGTQNVAYVQWTSLASPTNPRKPAKQASIAETIEQLSLCKYKARPHWGKNHERVFRHPECHVRDSFPATNVAQLLQMQQVHDPLKVFEPELFSHLLHKSGPDYSKLCTLQFWCYCQEDSHCPQSHTCQSSPAFPEYKVCKLADPASDGHVDI